MTRRMSILGRFGPASQCFAGLGAVRRGRALRLLACAALIAGASASGRAQTVGGVEALDRLLDLYVRDGLVHYAALRRDRAGLDRFVQSIAREPSGFADWPPEAAKAFWLNAYNGLVLRTVIDHYPIRGRARNYPADSIRQIRGAFDERRHRVAGRSLTLDAIETGVLPAFADPRLFLALGRGAAGSGRLRSEAYRAARVDEQLAAVVRDFAADSRHVALDRLAGELRVSAILGWREAELVAVQAARAGDSWGASRRSPIERAILTLVEPALFPSERAFLRANRFALRYQAFDWRLNDLTGGRP